MKITESKIIPKKLRDFILEVCNEKKIEVPNLKFPNARRTTYTTDDQLIKIGKYYREAGGKILTYAVLHELTHHIVDQTKMEYPEMVKNHGEEFSNTLFDLARRYYKNPKYYGWKRDYVSVRKAYEKRIKEVIE